MVDTGQDPSKANVLTKNTQAVESGEDSGTDVGTDSGTNDGNSNASSGTGSEG